LTRRIDRAVYRRSGGFEPEQKRRWGITATRWLQSNGCAEAAKCAIRFNRWS
jgi:hypothetical protein